MVEVLIVPTGTANLASVRAAFQRLGATSAICNSPDQIMSASHVMLPGVGAFGASMARLNEQEFVDPLRQRVGADRPTMAICVGHQLLFEASEESPDAAGLAILPGKMLRFTGDVRVPQFGWNEVQAGDDALLVETGFAYFANSYRAHEAPGWRIATSIHGGLFISAMERGKVIGCQFHPELSGAYGASLLARWLELR